jgi:hypothetical protein
MVASAKTTNKLLSRGFNFCVMMLMGNLGTT